MKVSYNKKLMEVELKYSPEEVTNAFKDRDAKVKKYEKTNDILNKLCILLGVYVFIIIAAGVPLSDNSLNGHRGVVVCLIIIGIVGLFIALTTKAAISVGTEYFEYRMLYNVHEFIGMCGEQDLDKSVILKEHDDDEFSFLFCKKDNKVLSELYWKGEVHKTLGDKIIIEVTEDDGRYSSHLYIPVEV